MANQNNKTSHTTEDTAAPAANTSKHQAKVDPQSKVRRKLDFGDEVDENLLQELQAKDWQSQRQRGIEKWNFDFENEIPLEGDWEWERVPAPVPDNKDVVQSMIDKHEKNRNV